MVYGRTQKSDKGIRTSKRHGANHDIYFNAEKRRAIPLKRHDFDENDLRYIVKEIRQEKVK